MNGVVQFSDNPCVGGSVDVSIQPMENHERLLRVEEAAAVLRISRGKTYEIIAEGRLKSVALDRCRRIRQADLDAFIRALPE